MAHNLAVIEEPNESEQRRHNNEVLRTLISMLNDFFPTERTSSVQSLAIAADQIGSDPVGDITSTNVQDAIEELDSHDLWEDDSTDSTRITPKDDKIIAVSAVDFDLLVSLSSSEGRLMWDSENGTLQLCMPGGNVRLQVGEELIERCKNETGTTISNGSVVYVTGSTGQKPKIDLADADIYAKSYVFGVATEDIATWGYVATSGLVRGVNTSGMPAGSVLWLSQTPGHYTITKPDAPAISVLLGIVLYEHATEGLIIIRPTYVPRLQALSDVYGTPVDGQAPVYNSTSQRFEFVSISSGGGISDAPSDGNLYGRKDGAWEQVSVSGGGAKITIDTYTNRPASPSDGDIFLPTNSLYAQVYDTSAWKSWGPVWRMTPFVLSDYSWTNQGSATVSDTNGFTYLYTPAASGNSAKLLTKSKTGNYTITMGIIPNLRAASYASCGFVFRESSSGKLVTFFLLPYSSKFTVSKYSSPTSLYAAYTTSATYSAHDLPGMVWMRIYDDGTYRVCQWSPDGFHWINVHSVSRTDFITADEVGICVDSNSSTAYAAMNVLSWEES